MYVNKNSVIINNINMGQYLLQADFEYNKLWASDSGRNMAGEQTGTLIRNIPKASANYKKFKQRRITFISTCI